MTILREEEHKALKGIQLSGKVLDLGGDKRSDYAKLFKGDFTITTIDINAKAQPDIISDLEQSLPVANASYNDVLMINVLEHIYQYRQLVSESARALVQGGKIVIIVPYMFPYHPSPNDYHRFSKTALQKLLEESGFKNITIKPLGSGLRSAQILFAERLMPGSLQTLVGSLMHAIARGDDYLLSALARFLGKKYDASDYALGFLATAEKI